MHERCAALVFRFFLPGQTQSPPRGVMRFQTVQPAGPPDDVAFGGPLFSRPPGPSRRPRLGAPERGRLGISPIGSTSPVRPNGAPQEVR